MKKSIRVCNVIVASLIFFGSFTRASAEKKTSDPVSLQAVEISPELPEWVRLPSFYLQPTHSGLPVPKYYGEFKAEKLVAGDREFEYRDGETWRRKSFGCEAPYYELGAYKKLEGTWYKSIFVSCSQKGSSEQALNIMLRFVAIEKIGWLPIGAETCGERIECLDQMSIK